MTASVRGIDLVANMGGDEFVILLNDLNDAMQLETALRRSVLPARTSCMTA